MVYKYKQMLWKIKKDIEVNKTWNIKKSAEDRYIFENKTISLVKSKDTFGNGKKVKMADRGRKWLTTLEIFFIHREEMGIQISRLLRVEVVVDKMLLKTSLVLENWRISAKMVTQIYNFYFTVSGISYTNQ